MWVQSLGRDRSPGEENGNPLQYSCLENSMDRGDLRATVHRVAKSQTELMWLLTYNTNDTNNLLRSRPQWEGINYDTDTWNNRKGYGLDEAPWILCFEIYVNKSLKLLRFPSDSLIKSIETQIWINNILIILLIVPKL